MNFWWFGVNNMLKQDGRDRPVILGEILPALVSTGEYGWPKRGNDRACYALIRPGDLGLLWTGHSAHGSPDWGIIGIVAVANNTPQQGHLLIRSTNLLDPPITPYVQGAPRGPGSQTAESGFLWSVFGPDFEPLHDVYSWLEYLPQPRQSIKTVYPVSPAAFLATLEFGKLDRAA
jgi:hypothetical protein